MVSYRIVSLVSPVLSTAIACGLAMADGGAEAFPCQPPAPVLAVTVCHLSPPDASGTWRTQFALPEDVIVEVTTVPHPATRTADVSATCRGGEAIYRQTLCAVLNSLLSRKYRYPHSPELWDTHEENTP
jgi:hypothetical protein